MLRSGPAITAHFAHRPRQSCRNRPGRGPITSLRLEQLTLFELEPEPIPVFYWASQPAEPSPAPMHQPVQRRRRRRAWLPRLIRWIKTQTAAG